MLKSSILEKKKESLTIDSIRQLKKMFSVSKQKIEIRNMIDQLKYNEEDFD